MSYHAPDIIYPSGTEYTGMIMRVPLEICTLGTEMTAVAQPTYATSTWVRVLLLLRKYFRTPRTGMMHIGVPGIRASILVQLLLNSPHRAIESSGTAMDSSFGNTTTAAAAAAADMHDGACVFLRIKSFLFLSTHRQCPCRFFTKRCQLCGHKLRYGDDEMTHRTSQQMINFW